MHFKRRTLDRHVVPAERDASGLWHVGEALLTERDFVRRYEPLGVWTPAIPGPPERVLARERDLRPAEIEATRESNGIWRAGKLEMSESELLALWEPTEPFTPYVEGTTSAERAVRSFLERVLTWAIERAAALRAKVALPRLAASAAREVLVEVSSGPAAVAGEVIER